MLRLAATPASVEEATSSLEQKIASSTQNAQTSRETEPMALQEIKHAEESGSAVKEAVEATKAIDEKATIIEGFACPANQLPEFVPTSNRAAGVRVWPKGNLAFGRPNL